MLHRSCGLRFAARLILGFALAFPLTASTWAQGPKEGPAEPGRTIVPGGLKPLKIGLAPAASGEVSAEEIRSAIDRGAAYLLRQQNPVKGDFREPGKYSGGFTALATLALLNSGIKPESPEIQKALRYLHDEIGLPDSTYVVALQTMVYATAQPDRFRVDIARNVKWLEGCQVRDGGEKGGWSYNRAESGSGRADPSNTQFAMLGLLEAERAGVEVNEQTWNLAADYWKKRQHAGGGWSYGHRGLGSDPTGSMTCAGLASLLIAQGHQGAGDAKVTEATVRCCGEVTGDDEVEQALKWLGGHFAIGTNPGPFSQHELYYLYALERVGRLSGNRYIGKHDWYREGAAHLIREQDSLQGFWKGKTLPENEFPTIATSFSLLFLSKGRWPVLMARVKYGAQDDWNQHRAAMQNLTRHVETRWKRDLTWQVIDLNFVDDNKRAVSATDLLQSPVLFFSGQKPIHLTPEQKTALKEYVNQGGFIFAEACDTEGGSAVGCDGSAFRKSFTELLAELFPESSLQPLPLDHAIWFAQDAIKPDRRWPVLGLNTCCRTSVIFVPKTLSCYWALHQPYRKTNYPDSVKADINYCNSLAVNVLAYATGRELKFKDERMQLRAADAKSDLPGRGVVRLAKISHNGGANDAPNALPNLLKVLRQQVDVRTSAEPELLPLSDKRTLDYPILFLHGRRNFAFSAEERAALVEFVARGGFVFGDSICANAQFTAAVRRELEGAFPDHKLARIPADHPIFTTEFRGFDLKTVSFREPQVGGGGQPLAPRVSRVPPQLEGIEIDGRYAVIFSPNDLSCGLESGTAYECRGYTKDDAARIGVNVLLYAMQQ